MSLITSRQFAALSAAQKDHVVGRSHATILKEQRTLYLDIYNPRLPDVYAHTTTPNPPEHTKHYHINRGASRYHPAIN